MTNVMYKEFLVKFYLMYCNLLRLIEKYNEKMTELFILIVITSYTDNIYHCTINSNFFISYQ